MAANKTNKINSPFNKTNQHDQKYKTILSAASELFNIHGTRGTTLTQIADKLQLTKTSLYYYVKTKEELVYQCYLNTCIEMQTMVENALTHEGLATDKLKFLLRQNFDCWNDIINGSRGHLAGLTEIASLSTDHKKEISEYYRNFVIQVINLIKEGQDDGSMQDVEPAKTSNAIWGTILWLPVWLYDVDQTDRESTFEQWVMLINSGLKNSTELFPFKSFTFDEVQMAPAGFNKKEQNRKKQEAFFRAGTMFFNQKGFKGTSLDELAQSLGVTKGAFYYHIKNKDDLLSRCFERTLKIEDTVLEQAIILDDSAINKLAYAAQRLFDIQVGKQGPLIRYATMWSFSPEKRKAMEVATSKIRDLFGEIIKQGVEEKTIKNTNLLVAENIIAGAIESIPDMNFSMDGKIISSDAADFYHIFFNGIAT
jgi:AcrR family transcriptional regulator|tara:strand:- start:592 stop:1863 length:1272 start_codon:yes stop_codon:yes gene_type:complete